MFRIDRISYVVPASDSICSVQPDGTCVKNRLAASGTLVKHATSSV